MTHKAVHRRTGRVVTPEEFVALEGPDYRARGVYPGCPICDEDLHPYGLHSPSVASRFDHRDGSRCPLSATPETRYAHLRPTDWDFEAGRRLRDEFCRPGVLEQGYAVAWSLCLKRLPCQDFVAMCQAADRFKVWAYQAMPLWVLPWILVTLIDLPVEQRTKDGRSVPNARRVPVRIVLEKPRRTEMDAVWIRPEDCRLRYFFADSGRPMDRDPVPLGDPAHEGLRGDTGWTDAPWFDDCRRCCDHV